jgi:hypothetical protein
MPTPCGLRTSRAPPGALNKKTRVANALDAAAEDVTKAVIDAAKDGDMQAAKLVLERIQPPVRPRAERVQFVLEPTGPLTAQAQQVLVAVAAGDLDPETGKLFVVYGHTRALRGQERSSIACRMAGGRRLRRRGGATSIGTSEVTAMACINHAANVGSLRRRNGGIDPSATATAPNGMPRAQPVAHCAA